MITTNLEFNKRNWDGENRWKRSELNEIAKSLNMTIDASNSNEKLFNRINYNLISLKTELFDFQNETVNRMNDFEDKYDGGFLLSEPGVGKTLCVIDIVVKTYLPTLIVCPSGLIDNWINEFCKHSNINKTKIVKYHGNTRNKIIDEDINLVYITSYSIVSREFDEDAFFENSLFSKKAFGRIVLDEAHYIRNSKTGFSRGVLALSNQNPNCKKWVVTATPIFNSYKDNYPYFKFLQLEGIDTRQDFTRAIVKNINGFKTLNEWISKYSIKYTKENVLKNLKEKKSINIKINFTETEQEFYDSLYDYSQKRMKKLIKNIKKNSTESSLKKLLHSNVMVFILRLRQACNSPWLILNQMKRLNGSTNLKNATNRLLFYNDSINLKEECPICYDATADCIISPCGHKLCSSCLNKMQNSDILNCHMCREFIEDANVISIQSPIQPEIIEEESNLVSSKITKLIEITNERIKNNEKVVIVSQWVSFLNLIKIAFSETDYLKNIKTISLQGSVPLNERSELIKNFQENLDIKICFISLNSSAEGITLTAANNLILCDQWWNNAKMEQVKCRIHRISQKKDVVIYQLSINNTIEDKMEKRVLKKDKITNLCLQKWIIKDISNYNTEWINEEIKLIENVD
jgi:SNF2 family DNA or RNA helicase